MAQIRNLSGDERYVEHLNRYVDAGAVFDVADEDVLQPNSAGEYVHDDDYMAAHPNARNYRVPGVFEVVGDLAPAPLPPTPEPVPAPAEAPSE